MLLQTLQRVEILLAQSNFIELERLCRQSLDEYPESEELQYFLALALLYQDKVDESDEVTEVLLSQNPADAHYLRLKANIEMIRKHFDAAEDKLKHLLKLDASDTSSLMMLARIKGEQRNYDKALDYLDKVLSLDAENIEALNMHSVFHRIIGNKDQSKISAQEALRLNPDSASSIANHGLVLLRKGEVTPALDRFQEALQIDPNNMMAQYGMKEALKSRFWPYKMLSKFGFWMSRFGGERMWAYVIGTYIGYRLLYNLAENNETLRPFLMPLVYAILIFFLSTWVFTPLMNLYLFTNKYGKHLLDKEEKESSIYVGLSLLSAVVMFLLYWFLDIDSLLYAALLFIGFMIPLGSMNNPEGKANKLKARRLSFTIIILGLLGIAMLMINGSTFLIMLSAIGLFAYQWILNFLVIKESSRTFGD